jgi:hypothetical protein
VAEWTLDVAIAPDAAVTRVKSAINLPKKRMLGVIKTQPEYVGVVDGRHFEIWERRQRAIHAVGEARGQSGGTRIGVHFRLAPPARLLIPLFFLLYALAAVGLATQPAAPDVSTLDAAVSVAGALFFSALFYGSARAQRRALERFLADALNAPRTQGPGATSPSGETHRATRAQ